MKLDDIKNAVDAGKKVYWKNLAYQVLPHAHWEYVIVCENTRSCIGLTWSDGVTLNGKEEDFYILN